MRNSALAFGLALLTFASMPQAAQARGGASTKEVLAFVTDTEIFIAGDQMALCSLVEQWAIMGVVPIYNEARTFALSPDNCVGEYYYDYSEAEVATAIENGLIPEDTPLKPSLSTVQFLTNCAVLGALGLIVVFGILGALFKVIGAGRPKKPKGNPELNEAALAAMCTVARADGEIDLQEANVVAAVSGEILGFQPKLQSILEMLHHAPSKLSEINFIAFGQGFTEKEKRVIMRGALRTATADGKICEAEHKVINGLAGGLMITGDEVRAMLQDISKPKNLRRVGAKNPNRYLAYEGRYENADGDFSAARNTGGFLAGIWGVVRSLRGVADDFF